MGHGINYNKYLISAINKVLEELFTIHNCKNFIQIEDIKKTVNMARTKDEYYESPSVGYGVCFKSKDALQLSYFVKKKGMNPYTCGKIYFSYTTMDSIIKDVEDVFFKTTEVSDKKVFADEAYKEIRLRDVIFDLYTEIVSLEAEIYNKGETDEINEKIDFNKKIIRDLDAKLKSFEFNNKILIYDKN